MAEGHRGRIRDRFKEENIDTIPDYMVIEKLLHGVIVRKDTDAVARELIRQFGGIPQIIDAPPHELTKISGIGDAAASFIKFVPQFYRRYCVEKWGKPLIFDNAKNVAAYLKDKFIGYEQEVLMVMCMDANCKLLACRPVSEGSISAVDINVRKILQFALSFNTHRIIIAHNHLHGDVFPSLDDVICTAKVYFALHQVGIFLDDHLIISGDNYISLAQSGYFEMVTKRLPHTISLDEIESFYIEKNKEM